MTEDSAALLSLRHYRTIWLGMTWVNVATLWQTEYEAVSTGAFAPLQILSSSGDGGTASAQRNFEQTARIAALQTYRAEKDADYATEVFAAPSASARPSVMYPLFSGGCFPH